MRGRMEGWERWRGRGTVEAQRSERYAWARRQQGQLCGLCLTLVGDTLPTRQSSPSSCFPSSSNSHLVRHSSFLHQFLSILAAFCALSLTRSLRTGNAYRQHRLCDGRAGVPHNNPTFRTVAIGGQCPLSPPKRLASGYTVAGVASDQNPPLSAVLAAGRSPLLIAPDLLCHVTHGDCSTVLPR